METTKDKLRMLAILSFVCFFAVSIGMYLYFEQLKAPVIIAASALIGYYMLFCIAIIFLSLKYNALEKLEEVDDDEIVEVREVALKPVGPAIERPVEPVEPVEPVQEVVEYSHASLIAQQLKNNSDALLQTTEDLRDAYVRQQVLDAEPIAQEVRRVRNVRKYHYGRDFAKRYVTHKRSRRVREVLFFLFCVYMSRHVYYNESINNERSIACLL